MKMTLFLKNALARTLAQPSARTQAQSSTFLSCLALVAMRLRRSAWGAALAFALTGAATAQPLPAPDVDDGVTFRAIALHDVRENVRATFVTAPEPSAVDETTLADFFSWLRFSNHNVISLQQIVDARAGGKPLPPRAVLLTFDDGYASAYTKVFPLLKRFGYPAVMALVTEWMQVPAGQPVLAYRTLTPPMRENFITWAQAREMAQSGLVEFASHSHALHAGAPGNPQGNQQPAAATLLYDAASGRYETDGAYAARIEADLRRSRALIEQHTGRPVRAMVWPYGAYTQPALAAAERAGMPITMTLDEGPNTARVALNEIRRGLATYDMTVPDYTLLRAPAGQGSLYPLNRAMHVDLDYLYDADPVQQEANLSALLERVLAIGPSTVFLQAFADPDGDGAADALYFPSRHMPMRADLFNRVAWQLRTRTGVQVYAWMPVTAFHLPAGAATSQRVVTHAGRAAIPAAAPHPAAGGMRYHRLTPFDADVRRVVGDIYEDLARHTNFAGILFHDDAMLGDDEDASPAALRTYAAWGLPADIDAIRADPALDAQWQAGKTRFLTDFTLELAERVHRWRPRALTARNLYARPVMQPESEAWFAQNYAQSLAAYDYTAVMAMPYMEEVDDPQAWLADMVRKVAATPDGLARTIFELQARDWRTGTPVPDATLTEQWSLLHRMGARHLAYYPDDFLNDQPSLATVRRALSVRATLQGESDGLDTPPALAAPKDVPPIVDVEPAPIDGTAPVKVQPR